MDKKAKQKAYHKEYYLKNQDKWPWIKDKTLAKSRKLKFNYGITLEQYEVIVEIQNGKCAICKTLPANKRLSVDHNHVTGKVRGLLCLKCNSAVAFAKEDVSILEEMISYIKKHSE